MNVFYLHKNPAVVARHLCDKHVVKMILEAAQLLSTAHRVLDGPTKADKAGLYKTTHQNHPSCLWTRQSKAHYVWLYKHFVALLEEYTHRYGKVHATAKLQKPLKTPPRNLPSPRFQPPPLCMPDTYKTEDPIASYRAYYHEEKSHFARWSHRQPPLWFRQYKPA